jgi:hypothetical protein
MRKIFISCFCLILCNFTIFAGDFTGYKTLFIGYGYAGPIGAMANQTDPILGGYAKSGSSFTMEYINNRSNKLGWGIIMTSDKLGMNQQGVMNANSVKDSGSQINYGIQKEPRWNVSTLMGGLVFAPITGKWTLETKLYGGFEFGKNPYSFNYKSTKTGKFANDELKCVGGIGTQVGTNLSYKINCKWAVKLSMNAYYGMMKYKTVQKYAEVVNTFNYSQPTVGYNLQIGLSYNFRCKDKPNKGPSKL